MAVRGPVLASCLIGSFWLMFSVLPSYFTPSPSVSPYAVLTNESCFNCSNGGWGVDPGSGGGSSSGGDSSSASGGFGGGDSGSGSGDSDSRSSGDFPSAGFRNQWVSGGTVSARSFEAAQVQLLAAGAAAPTLIEVSPVLVLNVPGALAGVQQMVQWFITSFRTFLPHRQRCNQLWIRNVTQNGAIIRRRPPPPLMLQLRSVPRVVPTKGCLLRLRGGGDPGSTSYQTAGAAFSSVEQCSCVGWRVSGTRHSPWYVCIGGHRLYDLDKGGVIHPEDFLKCTYGHSSDPH